mgnify:CR=1 FL=1
MTDSSRCWRHPHVVVVSQNGDMGAPCKECEVEIEALGAEDDPKGTPQQWEDDGEIPF